MRVAYLFWVYISIKQRRAQRGHFTVVSPHNRLVAMKMRRPSEASAAPSLI